MRAWRRPLLVCLFLASAGCGPAVDLSKGLQILDVSTGWFDAGVVDGQNKLVPVVTFRLKNSSDQTLSVLQVNAIFRQVSETREWGSAFLPVTGSEGLAPGATTPVLTARSQLGYTGSDQSRDEMLRNSHFVDAKVELLAKYSSTQWTHVYEAPIARQLVTK
jgi:hypothetical protein